MAIIIRIALLGLLSLSCSRWQNTANRLQIVCGPDVDPQRFSYVQIKQSDPTATDAIFYQDGQWQALKVSSYGCLQIPRDRQGAARIAIRDRNSTEGRILTLDSSEDGLGLVETELTAEPGLSSEQIRMVCASDPFVTQKRVALTRVAQPTRLLSKPVLRADIYDEQGQRVQELMFADQTTSFDLDASLKEGLYQVKLISQDAFERNAPPFESSCQIHIDRTPPIITSSLAQEPFYDQAKNIRQLGPEGQIIFQVEDASGAEPFVCLKPYPENCEDKDFQPLRSIRAPAQGLWNVQAYATDRTGQKSALRQETLAIFQQDKVNNLLTLLANVNINLLLGNQPEAMSTMLQAQKIREQLPLDGEQAAIQWRYAETFWKLDQQINLIRSIDMKQPIRTLNASTMTDHYLVQGDTGPALLLNNKNEVIDVERAVASSFADTGALWTVDSKGGLKLYEQGQEPRSFATDLSRGVLIAAGQTSDKVVIWADEGQETKVRVYDRRSGDDAPVFKVNLPKTPFVRGKYSFFGKDRYLIGKNNNQLLIWDSENNYAQQSYAAPAACVIEKYAVQLDHRIYFVSQTQRTPETGAIPPDKSFCDLQMIDLKNPTLNTTLAPRLTKVNYPSTLALSANPEQNFLVLGGTVGSFINILDLKSEKSDLVFRFGDSESPNRVDPMSEERPIFYVNTGNRSLFLQIANYTTPAEYFSSETLGNCMPQMRQRRLLCYQQDQSQLHMYSSERDRTLQPFLYQSNTRFNAADSSSQYQMVGLLRKKLAASFDQESQSIQLRDEEKNLRASARLPSKVTALSLHESGRLGLGLLDGTVAVLEEGQGLTPISPAEAGTIVSVHMTVDHVYAVKKGAADNFVLETYRYEPGRLSWLKSVPLPAGPAYSAIVFSEKSGRGVVYQKDRTAVTQNAFLFNQEGGEDGQLPMSMGSLALDRSGTGFHFVKDQSIYFHDFKNGENQTVAESISFRASAFLEGHQLYAVGENSSTLYAVSSGEALANGLQFGVGPQGSILVVSSNTNFKVLSPDGKTTLINLDLRLPTEVESILSAPDHSDIVLVIKEFGLGQGIKRLTTDLNEIDQRLKLWAN